MAHGDYDCCAVCDRKLNYNEDASTKEEICPKCAVNMTLATGQRITTPDALIGWIGTATTEQLDEARIVECFYRNPVDDAVTARRAALTNDASDASAVASTVPEGSHGSDWSGAHVSDGGWTGRQV